MIAEHKKNTLDEARTGTVESVRGDLGKQVSAKIDPQQLAEGALGACKAIAASAGMTLGQVTDHARPVLERAAASRGITLTHRDLDLFEATLTGLVEKANRKEDSSKEPAASISENSKTRIKHGLPVANASAQEKALETPLTQGTASSLSNGALFAATTSTANPITAANPIPNANQSALSLSKIMSALLGNRNKSAEVAPLELSEPLALEVGSSSRAKSTETLAAKPTSKLTAQQIEKLLQKPLEEVLKKAQEAPLTTTATLTRQSPNSERVTLKTSEGHWLPNAAATSNSSFASFARQQASDSRSTS